MTDYSKFIINIILVLILLLFAAFCIFIILNWNYISDPKLLSGYVEGQSVFANGRENLAEFLKWGFNYPSSVVTYLIYIESVLLLNLILRKNLLLSKVNWIVTLLFLLFMLFSDSIFGNLYKFIDRNDYWKIEYRFDYFLNVAFIIAYSFLLIASPILMSNPKFKKYRKLLILNLSTIILFLIFIFSHFVFFFD